MTAPLDRRLARTLLDLKAAGARLTYGEATGPNTVAVEGVDTALEYPALSPVATGDYVALLEMGADRLILGAVGSVWRDLTLASANWSETRTCEWRREGGRIWLRGLLVRTTSTFTASTTLFTLASADNPPNPGVTSNSTALTIIAALTPAAYSYPWVIDSGGVFRASGSAPTVAIGDTVVLDGVSWPA